MANRQQLRAKETKPRRWLQVQRRGSICLIPKRASMSVPPDDDALLAAAGSRGKFDLSATGRRLEDVEDEVGTSVIRARRRVIAEPMAVVNRDSHLGRVAVVQAICTAEVLIA